VCNPAAFPKNCDSLAANNLSRILSARIVFFAGLNTRQFQDDARLPRASSFFQLTKTNPGANVKSVTGKFFYHAASGPLRPESQTERAARKGAVVKAGEFS
jgi:hypothetical protein